MYIYILHCVLDIYIHSCSKIAWELKFCKSCKFCRHGWLKFYQSGSFALYRSFQILNLFVAFLLCICMKLKSTTQQRYATILDIHYYIDKLFSYAVHVIRSTCLNRHANDKAKQLSVFIIFFYYF